MKKIFILVLALTAWAMASAINTVKVTVAMNSLATSFQITPLEGQSQPTVTEVISREFEMDVVPGKNYKLKTYNKNNVWLGSIVLKFDFEDSESTIAIFTPSVKIKNTDWTLGRDCSAEISLETSEFEPRSIETSQELGYLTFPAVRSDVYTITGKPSATRASEGFMDVIASDPVTYNRTINLSFPLGYEYSLTVPTGAKAIVATKLRHYMPFAEVEPEFTKTNAGGTTTLTYRLAEKGVYNYRVRYADPATGKEYTTVAAKFVMPSESTSKEISKSFIAGNPDPKTVVSDPTANSGYNVADIFLNADYRGMMPLRTGEKKQIVSLRNWQITDNVTNNYFFEPDFRYSALDLDGQPTQSVISVDENGLVTALGKGTAILLVTYDALYPEGQIGGPFFGAIEPENTGVIVVTVDGGSSVSPNTLINETLNADYYSQRLSDLKLDAELDVLYYSDGPATYTFFPERVADVQLSSPTLDSGSVSYSGFSQNGVKKNTDGSYTITLSPGRNIVQMTDTEGRSAYQVIRAKKCTFEISNLSRPGSSPAPGDEVAVRVDGVQHPANKLAAVYNMNATVEFTSPSGEKLQGAPNQYQFASNQAARTITVTIPANWDTNKDFTLTDGAIFCGNYGNLYGSHRLVSVEHGRNVNFTAEQRYAYFGRIPSVTLYHAPNGIEDVSIDADLQAHTSIYDLMGRRLERISAPGIYVVNGKKVWVK